MLWEGDTQPLQAAPAKRPAAAAAAAAIDRPRTSIAFKTMRPMSGQPPSEAAKAPDRGYVVRRSGLLAMSPSLKPLRRLPLDCPAAEVLAVVVGEMAEVAEWLLVADGMTADAGDGRGGTGNGMELLFGVLCAAADQAAEAAASAPAPAPAPAPHRPEVVRHPRETPSQYRKRVAEVLCRGPPPDVAEGSPPPVLLLRPSSSPPRMHPVGFLSSSSPRQAVQGGTAAARTKNKAPDVGKRRTRSPAPQQEAAGGNEDPQADPLDWLAQPQAWRAAALRRRLSRGRLHAALPRVLRLHLSTEQFEGMWALLRCAHRHSVGARDFATAFAANAPAFPPLGPGDAGPAEATGTSLATDVGLVSGQGPFLARLSTLRQTLRTDAFVVSPGAQRALAALYQVANAFKAKKFTVKEVRNCDCYKYGIARTADLLPFLFPFATAQIFDGVNRPYPCVVLLSPSEKLSARERFPIKVRT